MNMATLRWDIECLYSLLSETRHKHGSYLGKVSSLKGSVGESEKNENSLGLELTGRNTISWNGTRLDATSWTVIDGDAIGDNASDGEDPLINIALVYLRSLLQDSADLELGAKHHSAITAQDLAKLLHIPALPAQIDDERVYMERVLERTLQTLTEGNTDVSEWVEWFLYCVQSAIEESEKQLEPLQKEQEFWFLNGTKMENDRQQKMVSMLLDGFEEKLTTTVWATLTDCSQDTALRDIQDLVEKGILEKLPGGGRSTAYQIVRK